VDLHDIHRSCSFFPSFRQKRIFLVPTAKTSDLGGFAVKTARFKPVVAALWCLSGIQPGRWGQAMLGCLGGCGWVDTEVWDGSHGGLGRMQKAMGVGFNERSSRHRRMLRLTWLGEEYSTTQHRSSRQSSARILRAPQSVALIRHRSSRPACNARPPPRSTPPAHPQVRGNPLVHSSSPSPAKQKSPGSPPVQTSSPYPARSRVLRRKSPSSKSRKSSGPSDSSWGEARVQSAQRVPLSQVKLGADVPLGSFAVSLAF
jgi:hypothetical protein